ncbi:MAG: hypothetical protein ACM3Q2_04130 [Syntrophothermus sp.]
MDSYMSFPKSNSVVFFILLSLLIFGVSSCKSSAPVENEDMKGRNYTWTADTINIPMYPLWSLWGSSESNLWACGSSGSFKTNIWYTLANQWVSKQLPILFDPESVWGFSEKDIWMVGQDLQIWHYDGNWTQSAQFSIPNYGFGIFMNIWGNAPNNIFAVGFADSSHQRLSLIYHYDGNSWARVNIPKMPYQLSKILGLKGDNSRYYILAHNDVTKPGADSVHVLFYDGTSFKEIFSGFYNNAEGLGLEEIDNTIYLIKGNKIYQIINDNIVFYLDYPNTSYTVGIAGRNAKDLFILLENGIAHYNGKDVAFLYKFNNSDFYVNDTFCFQNSIYLLAYDYATNFNIILKGKLNN